MNTGTGGRKRYKGYSKFGHITSNYLVNTSSKQEKPLRMVSRFCLHSVLDYPHCIIPRTPHSQPHSIPRMLATLPNGRHFTLSPFENAPAILKSKLPDKSYCSKTIWQSRSKR